MATKLQLMALACGVLALSAATAGFSQPAAADPAVVAAPVALQALPPSQFWTLAMTYQPEFCTTHAGDPGCAGDLAASKGFALRGFWPSTRRGPSDVTPIVAIEPHPAQLPVIPTLLITPLGPNLPQSCQVGIAYDAGRTCLAHHEFDQADTAADASARPFVQTAALLAERFRSLPGINGLIDRRAGRSVTASQLNGGASIRLICDEKAGGAWLAEIDVALDRNAYDAFPTPVSLHRGPPRFARTAAPGDLRECPTHGPIYLQ
jgi:ribonuclease I